MPVIADGKSLLSEGKEYNMLNAAALFIFRCRPVDVLFRHRHA